MGAVGWERERARRPYYYGTARVIGSMSARSAALGWVGVWVFKCIIFRSAALLLCCYASISSRLVWSLGKRQYSQHLLFADLLTTDAHASAQTLCQFLRSNRLRYEWRRSNV
jgi:hypothetical protein